MGELEVSWSFVFYTSVHFLVGLSQVLHIIVVPRIEISVACLGVVFKDSHLLRFKNSPSHFYFPPNHWNISREVFASRHFGITGKRSVRRLGLELSASEPHNHCSKTDMYDLSSLSLNLFRGWLVRTPASNSGLPDSDIGFRGLGGNALITYWDCVLPHHLQLVIHELFLLPTTNNPLIWQRRRINDIITFRDATEFATR